LTRSDLFEASDPLVLASQECTDLLEFGVVPPGEFGKFADQLAEVGDLLLDAGEPLVVAADDRHELPDGFGERLHRLLEPVDAATQVAHLSRERQQFLGQHIPPEFLP
jgi:hypothetical protein